MLASLTNGDCSLTYHDMVMVICQNIRLMLDNVPRKTS